MCVLALCRSAFLNRTNSRATRERLDALRAAGGAIPGALLTADLSKRFGNLHRGSRDIFAHMWFAEIDWDCLYRKEIPAPYIPNITVEGDASQFEKYPEVDLGEYGRLDAPDEFPGFFPDF